MSALSLLPMTNGRIVTSLGGTPTYYFRGLGFDATGLCIEAEVAQARTFQNGIAMSSSGRVITDAAGGITGYSNGLPLNSAGGLCVVSGAPSTYGQGVGFSGGRVSII